MTHAGLTSTMLWLMLLLGAYHGLNPGMGWLFAVALGMQEQKGSAVARSLIPIAVGHAVAIGSVVLTSVFLGMTLPLMVIRYLVAALLVGMGIYCLVRHRHPRWVRMQVTGLVAWVVYQKLGLALLRKAWFNFDLLWAVALVVTGLITLLI